MVIIFFRKCLCISKEKICFGFDTLSLSPVDISVYALRFSQAKFVGLGEMCVACPSLVIFTWTRTLGENCGGDTRPGLQGLARKQETCYF